LALWAVAERSALGLEALPPPPAPGRVTIDVGADVVPGFCDVAGFMAVGTQAVRIDMVDRLARAVHGIRDGRAPFVPDAGWVASIGLRPDGFVRLMRGLGYRLRSVDGNQAFAWGGARTPRATPAAVPPPSFSPFAKLADHPARSAAH
jgi:ATP-dependent RNA helicase SUPV3L1/SUV3